MKRILVSASAFFIILGSVFVASPQTARADATLEGLQYQITDLFNQISALRAEIAELKAAMPKPIVLGASTSAVCTRLTKTLYRGMYESPQVKTEIAMLQAFLKTRPEVGAGETALMSGKFDLATEIAVRRFQTANGIVSSGSPFTTGYGQVGSVTRAKIASLSCPPTPPLSIGDSLYGDMNHDGTISLADVVLLSQYTTGTDSDRQIADLNQDGVVDSYDVSLLRKVVLGSVLQSDLPIRLGDADGNGTISLADAVLISRYAQDIATIPNDKVRTASDVNKDGQVTDADVAVVRAILLASQPQ